MASERRERVAAWGFALLLLAVGAAAGVAGDRLLALRGGHRGGPGGPPTPEAVVERLTGELDLDAEQARRVRPIVEERFRALAAVFDRIDPEAEAIRRQADARIRELLRPPQRERFDRSLAERDARRAELRRRLGTGALPAR
jgi:hypothetical protein